jgi:ribosomal-protein-alanine N-acetyltransferase
MTTFFMGTAPAGGQRRRDDRGARTNGPGPVPSFWDGAPAVTLRKVKERGAGTAPDALPGGVGNGRGDGTIRAMPADPVRIELARESDAPALARMSRDFVEAGLGWTYRPPRVAALIRDAETAAILARPHARVAGFAVMTFGAERAHLVLLAVEPAWRRRGIARRLVGWLVDTAQVAGMASIHVELRADNEAAHAMYVALGFAETFRVPRYYRGVETAVRMVRVLRAPGVRPPAWQPPAAR